MAKAYFETAKISGIAVSIGENEIFMENEPNYYADDLAQFKKLQKMIGFNKRYWANPETTTSDLCLHASNRLMDSLHIDTTDIDAIISVTQTPDYLMPGNAHVLHRELALPKSSIALDVELGCSGYIYGLWLACMMIHSGMNRVLLTAGDTYSRSVNIKDRSEAPLFGDAGCATIVERTEVPSPAYFILMSDGQGVEKMYQPAGGYRLHSSEETRRDKTFEDGSVRSLDDVYMDGFRIFNFTMTEQPSMLNSILNFSGKTLETVDYFVLHQANAYIVSTITKSMGIPPEKVPNETFRNFGNQISASIAGAICHELAGKLHGHKQLIMQGFGIGLSWGACQVVMSDPVILAPEIYRKGM